MKPVRYGQRVARVARVARVGKIVCVSLGEQQQKTVAASAL
jgi:hypothetical protein